jgi:preprotein translocase subunit YajC
MSPLLLIAFLVLFLSIVIFVLLMIKKDKKTMEAQRKKMSESFSEEDIYKPL